MPRFASAPVEEILPPRKPQGPSKRTRMRQEYEAAARDALIDRREALVVLLEAEDNPLTIRNRIKRAAVALGIEDVVIRRRGDRIIAYREGAEKRER